MKFSFTRTQIENIVTMVNVKYKKDCPGDISKKIEKLALKSIIDDIKKTIDEDLGVLYFDNNLATWRNKEHERGLDSYLKQMTNIITFIVLKSLAKKK